MARISLLFLTAAFKDIGSAHPHFINKPYFAERGMDHFLIKPILQKMAAKKLKKAPLKEAIFELYWELPLDATNFPVDAGFDMALGKFGEFVKDRFPVHKSLFPPGNNFRIYPKPGHQFWNGEMDWPVVQIGPGILSVNETDINYIWLDNFRPNICHALDALEKSYAAELKFNKIRLLYIDAVDFDPNATSPAEFIDQNLLTAIHTGYELPGKLNQINIGQSFSIGTDMLFSINIQNGLNNATGNNSVIWTTIVERTGEIKTDQLLPWLDRAHEQASDFFDKMLKPEFYATFDR
jgi:uncharacterized protein (TIGR04255 family)